MATNSARSVHDYDIPPELADKIQIAFGLNEPPATLGDWVDATANLLDDADITVGFEDMCTADASRHEAQIGGEAHHFHCVLDTLLLPFVVEDQSTFDVRSRSPVSDTIVTLTVSSDTVEVTPTEAVMSFGVGCRRRHSPRRRYRTHARLHSPLPVHQRVSLSCGIRTVGQRDDGGSHDGALAGRWIRAGTDPHAEPPVRL